MKKKNLKSKEIAKKMVELMLDKKAFDIKVMHVEKLTSLSDIFIICSSDSAPQSRAIANHLKDELSKINIKPLHIEGYQHLKWVLMDYINIVVHIFDKQTRQYYNFERLWADAKIDTIAKS